MKTLTESVIIFVYTDDHFYRNKTSSVFILLSGDVEGCLEDLLKCYQLLPVRYQYFQHIQD